MNFSTRQNGSYYTSVLESQTEIPPRPTGSLSQLQLQIVYWNEKDQKPPNNQKQTNNSNKNIQPQNKRKRRVGRGKMT